MLVFPLRPTKIIDPSLELKTEVVTSSSGNEQRVALMRTGKRRLKLSIEGVKMVGNPLTTFTSEIDRSSPNFCLATMEKFFEEKAVGMANKFTLSAKPPLVPNALVVRFTSDSLTFKVMNRFFCNIEVEVVECW